MTTDLLVDADAFNHMRVLCVDAGDTLLSLVAARTKLVITDFIAHHELAALATLVDALCTASRLSIPKVVARTPEFQTYKELLKPGHKGVKAVHKGEAEAIAWAVHQNPRPHFISCDREALNAARRRGVPATDVMGLIVRCVRDDLLTRQQAVELVGPWNDLHVGMGRPSDYDGFASTFRRREQSENY